jgi:hypothetical protein
MENHKKLSTHGRLISLLDNLAQEQFLKSETIYPCLFLLFFIYFFLNTTDILLGLFNEKESADSGRLLEKLPMVIDDVFPLKGLLLSWRKKILRSCVLLRFQ